MPTDRRIATSQPRVHAAPPQGTPGLGHIGTAVNAKPMITDMGGTAHVVRLELDAEFAGGGAALTAAAVGGTAVTGELQNRLSISSRQMHNRSPLAVPRPAPGCPPVPGPCSVRLAGAGLLLPGFPWFRPDRLRLLGASVGR
ncbi:hypothetical protein KPP03845_200033 (plasmid) [Streptomyces xanthophaeus]|nr:hypothetical protein KPP03845_200033 [Streptomyces xanthophaeus]